MEATTVRKRGKLEELELGRMQQAQKRRTCRMPPLLRQSRLHHGSLGSRRGRNCICPNRTFADCSCAQLLQMGMAPSHSNSRFGPIRHELH